MCNLPSQKESWLRNKHSGPYALLPICRRHLTSEIGKKLQSPPWCCFCQGKKENAQKNVWPRLSQSREDGSRDLFCSVPDPVLVSGSIAMQEGVRECVPMSLVLAVKLCCLPEYFPSQLLLSHCSLLPHSHRALRRVRSHTSRMG